MAAAKHQNNYSIESIDPVCYELAEAIVSLKITRRQSRRLEEAVKAALLLERQKGFVEGVQTMLDEEPDDWGLGYES